MTDRVEELTSLFTRFPGIGPRQARRFVYHLLAVSSHDRTKLARLIEELARDVRQCADCKRFWSGTGTLCIYCADSSRDDSLLMLVEKDQDLLAVERAGTYRGRYFVLGGVISLSGKGAIREEALTALVERNSAKGLSEIILALSATSEGEHTADRVRELLRPLRDHMKFSVLGRGLATGSELEYADKETLSAAFQNRKET
ncbi:MAG TPA: toprim domain-containing protein [Candidatus Paceibacterota bacterium]|nr:toprim domain-containing protein [Candidatus Paceibacterota bacterium]